MATITDTKGFEFTANLESHDAKWRKVLEAIAAMEKKVVNQDRKNEMQIELGTTKVVMEKMERLLYLHLLQFTKGSAHARVVSNGIHGAFL